MKQQLLAVLVFMASLLIQANAQEPAIIMTTKIPAGEAISFSLSVKMKTTGVNEVEIDFGNGVKTKHAMHYVTKINGKVGSSQQIKIYGKDVTLLRCAETKLTALDVSNCKSLFQLDCSKNELKTLDLTPCQELGELYCQENKLTSIVLPPNSALMELTCNTNKLKTLDLTQQPDLFNLVCWQNSLNELDITQNVNLKFLKCHWNPLTKLDLTQNKKLESLDCSGTTLKQLDISNNTALEKLYCVNNKLTTFDASNNVALSRLSCNNNLLTALIVPTGTALKELRCSGNNLGMSSLPLKKSSWTIYNYSNQRKIDIGESIELGQDIDLSAEKAVGTVLSTYTWVTENGDRLTQDIDYELKDGITRFLKIQNDKVYCEIRNTKLPALTLSTELLKVTTTTAIDDHVLSNIKLYPNPCTNRIQLNDNCDQVMVYNLSGQLVKKVENYTRGKAIDISDCKSGIYLVEVVKANQKVHNKIIKQ